MFDGDPLPPCDNEVLAPSSLAQVRKQCNQEKDQLLNKLSTAERELEMLKKSFHEQQERLIAKVCSPPVISSNVCKLYTYLRMYPVCTHLYANTYMYVRMYRLCVYLRTYVCTDYVYTYVRTYVQIMCIVTYIHMYRLCVYLCTYVQIMCILTYVCTVHTVQ